MPQNDARACGRAIDTPISCSRCGGRFPSPGIHRNGQIYCCDKCAEGPDKKMMARMLIPAVGLVLFGSALGWSIARIRYSHVSHDC